MKRILHIVGGMNIGGTETMLMNIYRNINREKVQFDFISYYVSEGYYDKEIRKLGGKIINLPAPSSRGIIKAISDLCNVIKQYGPYEAVHCHTLFNCGIAVLAAYLCKIKVRVSHAHTTADKQNSISKKVYIYCMRILISIFSTNYVACSNSAANYLFNSRIIKSSRYTYLPNYIDYNRFLVSNSFSYIKKELNIEKGEKIVGHIGRFIDAKNHDFLIDVIAKMVKKNMKVKAILIGDGDLKEKVKSKVEAMGLSNKILFLGLREDIPEILKCMDLFIFPSIYEGLGLVLLEAQAVGLPCLVSEAIQEEADLGIGLVKKLELSKGADKWSQRALKILGKKKNEKGLILDSFIKRGYTLDNILNKLNNIYRISDMVS